MSVRIKLTIEVEDGFTIEDLKEWVAAEDEIASGKGQGIAAVFVKPSDIYEHLLQSGFEFKVTEEEMTE
jgi:hypothetical protein